MAHRDVSVAVCGVVVGVILGAGSIAFASGNSLMASAQGQLVATSFHAAPNAADYSRRKIDARGLPLYRDTADINHYPTVKEDLSSSSVAATGDIDVTACTAVQKTVAKLMAVYKVLIPNTYKNTELLQNLDSAFMQASNGYCTPPAATTSNSSSSVAAVTKSDNHCEQYPKRTSRYTQCVIANEHGARYP